MATTQDQESFVFFDIQIDGKAAGTIIMRLYFDKTPKTAENFKELCKGQRESNGTQLTYAGSQFHRVIKK